MSKKNKCTNDNCDGYIYYGSGNSVKCDCEKESKKEVLQKELAKIEAKEKKEKEKYYKYKEAGCTDCHFIGHTWSDAGMGFNNLIRCDCTYIKTKRYKKALAAKHLKVEKYNRKLSKFVDNNKEHNSIIHDTDRSW